MGYSQQQKKETREKILALAAKKIREHGYASLAIGELMKEAGLTVGGFYAHFESREDLLQKATERAKVCGSATMAGLSGADGPPTAEKLVSAYLSEHHVKNAGTGCVVSSVAGEGKNASPEVKAELVGVMDAQVEALASLLKGRNARGRALAASSALVGAVSLARMLDDPKAAAELLKQTKKMVLEYLA